MFIIYWNEFSLSTDTDKFHRKTETKKVTNFPASYVDRFYRNLGNDFDSAVNSDFYGRNPKDTEDVQKSVLANSNFAKGMQYQRIFFEVKIRRNFFACFRTCDAKNLGICSFLKELDTGRKFIVSDHVGKAPRPRLPTA